MSLSFSIVFRQLGKRGVYFPWRWILLAVLVVGLTATATVVVQSVSLEPSIENGPGFPAALDKSGPLPKAVVDGELTYKFGSKALALEVRA